MKVEILGAVLGEASGWDAGDDWVQYYDYTGDIKELMETTCFTFHWIKGTFEMFNDDGEVVSTYKYDKIIKHDMGETK